jgi:hypothetical protein
MFIPKILIDRLRPGMYGWQVSSEQEVMDEDFGDNSIEGCLDNAIDIIPPSFTLVEILYCGFHMGTFAAGEVRSSAKAISRQIHSLYGALVETA